MPTLSANEIKKAKAWLHDVFIWGGVVPADKSKRGKYYALMYGSTNTTGKEAAKRICDEIIYRKFDFTKVDAALETLSTIPFNTDASSVAWHGKNVDTASAAQLASYIGWYCNLKDIIWDAGDRTVYELDAYNGMTIGKALLDWHCFSHQDKVSDTGADSSTSSSSATKGSGSSTSGSTSSVGHRATTGGKSEEACGLIGKPHDKIHLTGILWTIEADRLASGNVPTANIDPLSKSRCKGGIPEAKISVANGYSTAALYFYTYDDAYAALDKLLKTTKIKDDITGIHVAKCKKLDPNGYFKFNTTIGEAYIRAYKLNEEVEEITESCESSKKEPLTEEELAEMKKIFDFDRNYHRYDL